MARQFQNLFKFRNFYDQIDFDSDQRLAVTKAITELNDFQETDLLKGFHTEGRGKKWHCCFYEEDKQISPGYDNRPLYITTSVNDVKLRWGLVDPGSSLNIMPFNPRGNRDPSSTDGCTANWSIWLWRKCIIGTQLCQHQLRSGAYLRVTMFHILDAHTSYCLLFGRLLIHKYHFVPSTNHCLKSIWRRKKVHVNPIEAPSRKGETHLLEAASFNELVKMENSKTRPCHVSLPKWEGYEQIMQNSDSKPPPSLIVPLLEADEPH